MSRTRVALWAIGALLMVGLGSAAASASAGAGGDLPVIVPGAAAVTEGDTGTVVLEVPVTLTEPSAETVTVEWTTIGVDQPGLATPGIDHAADAGTVTFAPGSTAETVELAVFGDTVDEPDLLGGEWALIRFFDPSPGANLDTSFFGLGIGVIVDDDDPPPTITPGTASVVEGDEGTTTVDVPVTLSNPSPTEVTVEWSTWDWPGSATGDVDYIAGSGTTVFPAGETSQVVTVTVNGDVVAEPGGEHGLVRFSNASANAVLDTRFYGLGSFHIVDDGDVGSAGCGGLSAPVTEMRTLSTEDGLVRDYRLHIPDSYDPGRPEPLVLNLPGSFDPVERMLEMTRTEELADAEGFVTVVPVAHEVSAGAQPGDGYVTWNSNADPTKVDDLAFLEQLLDRLEQDTCVDVDQTFVMGLSAGAGMTALTGCVLPDRIAAVASVASFNDNAACVGRPPAVVFHGDADEAVPFAVVQHRVSQWAAAAGCGTVPEATVIALDYEIEHRTYAGCGTDGALEFYVIRGGGHRWPGDASPLPQLLQDCCVPPQCLTNEYPCLGETTLEMDATATAWRFFQDHQRN